MNFADWYTDRTEVYRVSDVKVGSITKRERALVASGIPCRVYQSSKPSMTMADTAAHVDGSDKLMCGMDVDIRKGDELLITRSGGEPTRYFAGKPQEYAEPFGAVLPGLAHKELSVMQEERT
ncbi:hypothetical protein [Oscillibacter sp.]|uniref:hypothetical protein n=1 Tax=Oscillibacter sp. TaxID=1945593 RepID=UPI002898C0E3|nr:hypothetical protein [Oscillibacter sp.]